MVATSYINSFDGDAKAKNYLEDVVRLNMQHRGPYHSSTIKAQVWKRKNVSMLHISPFCSIKSNVQISKLMVTMIMIVIPFN